MSSNMVEKKRCYNNSPSLASSWHSASFELVRRKENHAMSKTIDAMTEIIRDPKHPFRKADDRPAKAQKHRYERRKIKEYIKQNDWDDESPA